ncbi:unnamed protein product [Candida verbasci]|uniref:Uncharacterized protein n=1 Tax=Candida verbasci TaxID=1227364 RepID=A0A9W4TZ47_9ASCO|nr:unnamed protein product [Candida verbasci]
MDRKTKGIGNQDTDYSSDDAEDLFTTLTTVNKTKEKKVSNKLITSAAKLEIESITLKDNINTISELIKSCPVEDIKSINSKLDTLNNEVQNFLKNGNGNNDKVVELLFNDLKSNSGVFLNLHDLITNLTTISNNNHTILKITLDKQTKIESQLDSISDSVKVLNDKFTNQSNDISLINEFLGKFTPRIINLENLFETLKYLMIERNETNKTNKTTKETTNETTNKTTNKTTNETNETNEKDKYNKRRKLM